MQNEPNLQEPSAVRGGPIVQNEPNLEGPAAAGARLGVQNEANLPPDRPEGTRGRSFHRLECAKRSQSQASGQDPRGQSCKTNPIWRVEQGLGACRAKQSQSAVGARQWARDGKSPCRCRRARFCKTNPISGSWPAGEIPHYSSILLFHHSIRCQACETKPISLTAEWPRTGVWSPAFTRF